MAGIVGEILVKCESMRNTADGRTRKLMIREGTGLWYLFKVLAVKKQNFCIAFNTPQGKAVLRYLNKYCFANSPTHNERENGRRDVWLFINHFLRLDEEELTVLYSGLSPEERFQIFKPGLSYIDTEN
jgi:hypothetical protein